MLGASPFGQTMRLPPNCPSNFFMNPALVASQLQCKLLNNDSFKFKFLASYMQQMAALSAAIGAKQNEQQ